MRRVIILILLLVSGCQTLDEADSQQPTDNSQQITDNEQQSAEDDGLSNDEDGLQTLTIIYTNDEHGWLEGMSEGSGAAEIVGLWQSEHGCVQDDDCLILSGGDMWTGPAISTWFEGESMADVMNVMGYDAAAIGNHEFDFGLERLRELADASTFPFVSANIRNASDGKTPTEWGIEPFVIIEQKGLKIGVIGLTTTRTPDTTLPQNVADFDFIDYEEALREVVPQAIAAGAELIVVPGHICSYEVDNLAMQHLGVALVGGGHCNELIADVDRQTNVIALIGGFHLTAYAYANLTMEAGEVVDIEFGTNPNQGGNADPVVADVVAQWQQAADEELNVAIGYLDRPIERRSLDMQNLITYAWLHGYPSAEIAVTNLGGMRATFQAGELTLGDIIGVMPFDNVIYSVELTGDEFVQIFGRRLDAAIAGVQRGGSDWIVDATGQPLVGDKTYTVLVNNFMYGGGDGYTIADFDPNGYNTAIDWRQPVIDWIEEQDSSSDNPLNSAIESIANP